MPKKTRSRAQAVKRLQRSIRKFGMTDNKVEALKYLKRSK